jgi:hypothetical protein
MIVLTMISQLTVSGLLLIIDLGTGGKGTIGTQKGRVYTGPDLMRISISALNGGLDKGEIPTAAQEGAFAR